MTARQATAMYRVEQLGSAPDKTPLWGIRRPDGTWVESMGQPAWYIRRPVAERDADELNRNRRMKAQP